MIISIRAIALGAAGLGAIAAGTYGFARGGGHVVAVSPPAVYGLDPGVAPLGPAVQSPRSHAKRVSVSFADAPLKQVLAWLSKQDANFVVASSSVPSALRITLNATDEPLSSVEKVIADAMGGSWVNSGDILVFRPGFSGSSPLSMSRADTSGLGNQLGPQIQEKLQEQFGPDFQKKMQDQFGPEFQKKIQEKMQEQFGPDFQKKMQDQ
ncbi:MAG: hypothetical protein ACYC96_09445, partial [Fimbriimonadaceae bacterium]